MKIAEDVKFYFIWNHRCENMELYRQSCLSKSNQNIVSDAWARSQGLIALQFDSTLKQGLEMRFAWGWRYSSSLKMGWDEVEVQSELRGLGISLTLWVAQFCDGEGSHLWWLLHFPGLLDVLDQASFCKSCLAAF